MLQTDLFFSYGLASGLAIAASSKLKAEPHPLVNKYFVATILWLSLLFVPQILYLMKRFPAWESMFVARSYADYPPWFMSLYPIATVIIGMLGFQVTNILLKKGNTLAAMLQGVWSFAVAMFLSIVGWDGAGYRRLLYPGTGDDWANGVIFPLADFFTSPVFLNLLWLEALLLIPYSLLFIRWVREKE